MNTTAAALEAQVTTATIRTWCRRGVVGAIKVAGRWIIDTASLTRRIAIGATRTRKAAAVTLDLNATYADVTPTIKHRTTPHAGNIISISGLAPFFADRFESITDEGDRMAALTVFRSARIVISDQPDTDWDGDPQARESGQLRTTYRGGVARITIDDVLDLAAQLRTQLTTGA